MLLTATKEQLISKFNLQVEAVTSLNAAVTMKLTAGSAYTGVIEQYHEVDGFVLAQRPSSIRVIGQAPVVAKNIFDMVSNGEAFQIFIPSKNKFIVGSDNLERPAKKPIENLRPQHLIDAILWPAIAGGGPVLFEEASEATSRYYVLTVVRPGNDASTTNRTASATIDWEIARKIWFDRTDLNIARIQSYDPDGRVASDVRCGSWTAFGASSYPKQITLTRPADDYELRIGIKRLSENEPIPADRFVLKQPPGTERVRVGEEPEEPRP